MSKGEKLVEVYRATNEMEAQVVKSMLEGFNIPCLVRTYGALASQATLDFGKVSVMCLESVAERARELLRGESGT